MIVVVLVMTVQVSSLWTNTYPSSYTDAIFRVVGTARVDCLALNGETPAPDFTVQVATALGITFVQ
jgi:hypothetical protein